MSSLELEPADLSERMLRESRWTPSHIAAVVWGVVLAIAVSRVFFAIGHGQFFENHDGDGYGLRLIEFRDCVWNGYLLPQWCTHFRGGLGAPFFNYYQPGFFYVASLTPSSLPVAQQLGLAVVAFSIISYLGTLRVVWSITRAKQAGLGISLVALCVGFVAFWRWQVTHREA